MSGAPSPDVVVVGAGNAALCAALAAPSAACRCWCSSARPKTRPAATAASRRAPCAASTTASRICKALDARPDRGGDRAAPISAPTPRTQFFDDMGRVTEYRTDPELLRDAGHAAAVDTMRWMRSKGVRFAPIWGRQAFKVDGKFKFWGGLTVEAWGGGPGLVDGLDRPPRKKHGIDDLLRRAGAVALIADDDGVAGRARAARRAGPATVTARKPWCWPPAASRPTPSGARAISARAGSSPRCAARASTPATASAWRSTIGAMPTGNWSGCHAVGWDRNAPEFGDLAVGDNFQKHTYPFGIMINANGRALRRRGRRLPQLHLRQVRPRDPRAAGAVRLADLRREGAAPAARRIPHQAASPRSRPTRSRSWCAEARRRRRADGSRDDQGLQRRGEAATCRSIPTSRTAAAPSGLAVPKSNWANTHRRAAVRGLCRDLRHHLHLRRPEDRHAARA